MAEHTEEFIVEHLSFPYTEIQEDALGNDFIAHRLARRGEVITLTQDKDIERGLRLGSIKRYDPDAEPEVEGAGEEFDDDSLDPEYWAERIKEESPNVNDTVEWSGGDGEVAQAILEGERIATGDDPRKGVVAGLTEVITRAVE